jgi:hypothetical protein
MREVYDPMRPTLLLAVGAILVTTCRHWSEAKQSFCSGKRPQTKVTPVMQKLWFAEKGARHRTKRFINQLSLSSSSPSTAFSSACYISA